MTPTCVAARPMPSESCMSWPIRRISSRSASSKRSISSARLRSTGSPYLRTSLSAASRRARVSGSSRGAWSSSATSTSTWSAAMACTLSAVRGPAGLIAGSTSTEKRRPGWRGAFAAASTAARTAAIAAARSAALTTTWERWRPRSRNSGAGPSTVAPGAPAAASAISAAAARGAARVLRRADDPDQVGERRVGERAPALELAGARSRRRRGGRRRRSRARPATVVCTSTRPPARPAAGAARELGDQRERPLLGAEVREAQRRVGVDDDAERHVREVVPLGDHLRADEQPGGRGGEAGQQRGHGVLGARGVGVEPEHRHVERFGELGLQPLRARAVAGDGRRAARVAALAAPARGGRSGGTRRRARRGAARARRRTAGTPTPSRTSGR